MHCPFCRHTDSRVVDSRVQEEGTVIRRRRQCPECGRRFGTVETATLSVIKRSGATEPFSRDKVLAGVRKGRFIDNLVTVSTLFVISIPVFVIGVQIVSQYVYGS